MAKRKTVFVRFMAQIPEDLMAEVDDFRFGARIPSRMEAIRALIRKGLKSVKKKPPTATLAVRSRRKT